MIEYTALLDGMMKAVLTGKTSQAEKLFHPAGKLSVYTEGYNIRLHKVLAETYPATLHYLGEKSFATMAADYIAATPARHFNLDRYPLAFATFINDHCKDGIVKEITALEGAMAEVYLAGESIPVSSDWTEQNLAAALLKPRTASALLSLDYEVNDYMNSLRAGEKPTFPAARKTWLLIYRHWHQLHRLVLSEGEHMLLTLLDGKTPLASALESERFAPFGEKVLQGGEFMRWFARWTKEGCLCLAD